MDLISTVTHIPLGITLSLAYPAEQDNKFNILMIEHDINEIRRWCIAHEIPQARTEFNNHIDANTNMHYNQCNIIFEEEKYATLLRMSIRVSSN